MTTLLKALERFGIPALYVTIVYVLLNYLTFTERGTYILKKDHQQLLPLRFLLFHAGVAYYLVFAHFDVFLKENGEEKKIILALYCAHYQCHHLECWPALPVR